MDKADGKPLKWRRDNPHNQLKDAAFQAIAATKTGREVRNIFIVHLNKDYVRNGEVDPAGLLTFADETARVKGLLEETEQQIADALALLNNVAIDESSCSCLNLSRSHHCDSFDYFNPDIPKCSIYLLPRLSGKKLGVCDTFTTGIDVIGTEISDLPAHRCETGFRQDRQTILRSVFVQVVETLLKLLVHLLHRRFHQAGKV